MKFLLMLFLAASFAAVASARHKSSTRNFHSYLKKLSNVCHKVRDLEQQIHECCDRSGCTYDGQNYDHGAFFPASDDVNQCWCNNGTVVCTNIDSLSYRYFDEIAQAYCATKLMSNHVFAVRRNCPTDAPMCNTLCGPGSDFATNVTAHISSAFNTFECYDGIWLWMNHPTLALNPGPGQPDAGQLNLGSYSYGSTACTWTEDSCGPNYCCCRAYTQ